MPSFPPPGSVTICEINRDFITAENISDAGAKETYGKVLGVIFSPIQFQSDLLLANFEQGSQQVFEENVPKKGFTALKVLFNDSFKRVFLPKDVNFFKQVDLQGVGWHQHKHILAFISGPNQVIIWDYEDPDGKDPSILTSEAQRDIKMIEWRPNGGRTLSVACKGGICLWSASYPGNAAFVRSGVASFLGSVSRESGARWTLVDFLRSIDGEEVTSLSWSPNGRYLASASFENSSFTIWDISQGVGTPIRRGLGGISILKWSPTGDYFFTGKLDGTFYLWETNTWTSECWSSSGGHVTGAMWDPDGRLVLIAFSESVALAAVHFATKPPSLDAHLLPVALPEIGSFTGSGGIEKIAWDASGERLALSYKGGSEIYSGLIAVYDTRRTPLVSASLIGFIRGPGESPKPLGFSFHDKFKQGPLLAVSWSSGWCCTYPLLFR